MDKTQAQLIEELTNLRQQVQQLETSNAEYKQALEALQEERIMALALLESASDGVVVVDEHGHIVLINPRIEQMFGYARDELLGQPVEILLPEHLRDIHPEHREDYYTRPHSRPMGSGLDLTGRHRDGTELPIEVSLSFIHSEDKLLTMALVMDITQRKQAEHALQETLDVLQKRNRDLALLNQASRTLTATLDLQEVTELLLEAVTKTIGAQASSVWLWDPEEPDWLVCQAMFHLGQKYPSDHLRLAPGQGIAGWVAQTGESLIVSYAPDDSRHTAEIDTQLEFQTTSLLSVPLRVRDKILGTLQVVNKLKGDFDADDKDLIETLATSAAIAIDNAQLVRELRQYTKKLQTRNEELDTFAHTVAHDLKNPLGLMIGFAAALEENLTAISTEELRRHLHTITQSGQKMRSIINELLLLAGVRKTEAEMHPLDMASIVAEVQSRLVNLIQDYEAEITSPETWPEVLGYGPWIEEVWTNYLSNAIRYGGHPPRIEVGATVQADNSVRFWVRDNGHGLTSEDQTRLFTPFTQLHQVRTEGHGLGLSIVRRIVEKLGGEVGVESQVGQGSTFYFTLPSTSNSST